MCIWYKRLERGRFHFPAADAGSLELTPGQLQMILDGVDVEHLRRFKRYQRLQPA
jgi:transposase